MTKKEILTWYNENGLDVVLDFEKSALNNNEDKIINMKSKENTKSSTKAQIKQIPRNSN